MSAYDWKAWNGKVLFKAGSIAGRNPGERYFSAERNVSRKEGGGGGRGGKKANRSDKQTDAPAAQAHHTHR